MATVNLVERIPEKYKGYLYFTIYAFRGIPVFHKTYEEEDFNRYMRGTTSKYDYMYRFKLINEEGVKLIKNSLPDNDSSVWETRLETILKDWEKKREVSNPSLKKNE